MSTIADECKLSFYEEIIPLKENRPFWLVRHRQTEKYYVKKVLSSAHREVYEALRGITSRNLPRIYECISLEEQFVVIEEFINGDTLEELVQQQKIAPGQAVSIITDICNVLFILHSMVPPIIHRDIKPGNIMVSNDGVVKLMDFNIARTYDRNKSQDTAYMGTAGYAAPEHFGFGQTDARSDIYSCGVVLNYLLTGQMPEERLADEPFRTIIQKCTEISPAHRYQNAFELRQALGTTSYPVKKPAQNFEETPSLGSAISQHPRSKRDAQQSCEVLTQNAPAKQATPAYRREWQKFLPPGFRTLKPWKMFIAVVFYAAIIDVTFNGNFEATSAKELMMTRIFAGIGMFCSVFVLFNYLGVSDRLPGASRIHGKAFWLLRCIYAFAALFLVLCILVILLDFLP